MRKVVSFIFLLALVSINLVAAATVPVSVPANGSASTSVSSQLEGTGTWNSNFKFAWNISQVGSLYHYVYSITKNNDATLAQNIQYLILEVSPFVTSANLNTLFTTSSPTITSVQNFPADSLPGSPSNIYGLKFDFSGNTTALVDFTTSLAPMWGDFYANGGKELSISNVYAYNQNIGTDPFATATNFSGWVPVPGILFSPVPEPTTWLILGSTLFAVLLLQAKRRDV